jgi:hypothetical protein
MFVLFALARGGNGVVGVVSGGMLSSQQCAALRGGASLDYFSCCCIVAQLFGDL